MSRDRQHDLDWLRLAAIVLLQLFHTGMMFVPWEWHIKNPQVSEALTYPMVWLHYWRMPLLLVISGAGTCFALGFRSPGTYLWERFRRLFIPLVFGMLVIVPPQIYFERISQFSSYWSFWRTVFDFVPYPLGGSLSWHHLWFILYLMLFSIVSLPFMLFLRSDRSQRFRDGLLKLVARPAGFGLFLIPLVISQIVLRPYFPEFTNGLVDDWASFAYYLSFFLFGFVCCQDRRLWSEIGTRRRGNAIVSVAMIAFFFVLRELPLDWDRPVVRMGYLAVCATMAWYWILALLGYAQVRLNKPSPVLRYANEALYPFYILHQTAIIFVGYYVIRWNPGGVFIPYVVVCTVSAALTMAIYHWVIRPSNLLRPLFGMKRSRSDARTAVPVGAESTLAGSGS